MHYSPTFRFLNARAGRICNFFYRIDDAAARQFTREFHRHTLSDLANVPGMKVYALSCLLAGFLQSSGPSTAIRPAVAILEVRI